MKLIEEFLQKHQIANVSDKQQFIKLVQTVAAIPWGKGRTIEDVLQTQKVDTCTGKHLVLQACFEHFGLPTSQTVCTFKWSEQGINYPPKIQSILDQGEWEHGHNIVNVTKTDGKILEIDVIWDPQLKPYGFTVIPEDWDGESSFAPFKIIRRWENADLTSLKAQLIDSLDEETRQRRQLFLDTFFIWIQSLRNQ